MDSQFLKDKSKELRLKMLEMCEKAGVGHITSSFSCTEILVALYYGGVLNVDPREPNAANRDRFILSKGQASVALYNILADLNFFPKEKIWDFCQENGAFGVHLQNDVPGVEITTGSLGHGLGVGVGIALSLLHQRSDSMVFTLLGDGECYEGSIWESAMFASHHRLSNLVAVIDRNYLCATHFTEEQLAMEPLKEKWESFGWQAYRMDGHNVEELRNLLYSLKSRKHSVPSVVIADTVKGKGSDFISHKPLWHARAPLGKDLEIVKNDVEEEI